VKPASSLTPASPAYQEKQASQGVGAETPAHGCTIRNLRPFLSAGQALRYRRGRASRNDGTRRGLRGAARLDLNFERLLVGRWIDGIGSQVGYRPLRRDFDLAVFTDFLRGRLGNTDSLASLNPKYGSMRCSTSSIR